SDAHKTASVGASERRCRNGRCSRHAAGHFDGALWTDARPILSALAITPCSRGRRRDNGREDRYLIVTCTVITRLPEAIGPCPVALMANVSLPLYLAFALYS